MTRIKRFLMIAVVAGSTALASTPANAFFGMLSSMLGGPGWGGWGPGWGGWGPGWGGWGPGWGYPYYGYGWGYPYYGYGYGWGYPYYGYGWGYPYAGGWANPWLTAPPAAAKPATSTEK